MIDNKATVKTYFENGDKPTQSQFADLIDSTMVPTVIKEANVSGSYVTDCSDGDTFELVLIGNTTIEEPTNPISGKTVNWLLTQANVGSNVITLDSIFVIPASATTPLAFSATTGLTDVLAARYHSDSDKWLVIGLIPGYTL